MMIHFYIAAIKNKFKVCLLFNLIFGLTLFSCNHLLYPADRFAFVDEKKILPRPQNLSIPVSDSNSFLHAWLFRTGNNTKKGLVVHFHGNGQNLTTHFLFFKWITDYGYDYLIFDYRGYGASSDESASQEKTIQDGIAVFSYIYENFRHEPLVAIGQSLGSNVLVRTLQELNRKNKAAQFPKLVVLDSSFQSYQQAGSSVLSQRWFLYPFKPFAYVLLDDKFSAKALSDHTPELPAVFFHGTKDSIINYDLGRQNYEQWPGPKLFVKLDGGGHTSAFSDRAYLKNKIILLECIDAVLKNTKSLENCSGQINPNM